jgi:protein involved in polysaccharide export with SLBB domain
VPDPNLVQDERLKRLLLERGVLEPNEPNEPDEPNEPNQVSLEAEQWKESEEPSRIELLFSGQLPPDVCDVSLDLKQFGYDVFRNPVTTFAPVTNVPVGPDYVIGPGDSFTLTLWGRMDAQHTLHVDRNGQVVLPEVGALKVWGMRFGELDSYLQHELSRKYADFKMSISMDRLRSIRIFVVGEISAPGTYTVSSLSTVINVLFAAGGPSKNGSLRRMRLSRNSEDPAQIDLYDFLLGGDRRQDLRLQDGDTIFVPLVGPVVAVAGNVKRPAIYEMAAPMNLSEVLDLAGGVTFAGWLQRVQVERVEDHQRRIVVDFDMSRGEAEGERPAVAETLLQDGDIVKVFAVAAREEKVVYLEGHAIRPGKYGWRPGMRLADILTSYDVLPPQPNLDYGEVERLTPPDLHPVIIPFHLGRLLADDESENVELAQYDIIRVFRWDERNAQSVTISGMVYDPCEYRLAPDMKVNDLVNAAGGLHKNAYLRKAEITRRHISQEGMRTEKIDIDLESALAGDPEHNIFLRDYDYLVIRPIPDLEFGRTAEVHGEVRFPGTYPIRKGETLSSLIERAGDYTDEAYLRGAIFTRESAKEVQRRRLDELIREIEESMLASTEQTISGALDAETIRGQQTALEAKRELLAKLRSAEITGRVVVRLDALEEFKRTKYDIELEDGDSLTIPRTPGVVHVIGEVFNPTSLLYEDRGTVSYYLRTVGGMTKEADKDQLSVIKADGSVISIEQGDRGKMVFWDSQFNQWVFGGFMNHQLEPGDTIVVPRKVDRFFWLKTTKDLTQIIFQIAVAAGVVLAI